MDELHSDFTGEIDAPSIDNPEAAVLVSRINERWLCQTNSILETALLSKQALDIWGGSQKSLVANLCFDRSTFNKLVSIAKHERLHDPELFHRLPPHFSLLYAITQLDPSAFEAAMSSGLIHAKMNRSDINRLRGIDDVRRKGKLLRIRVDWSSPICQKAGFAEWLHTGEKSFGLLVDWPRPDHQSGLHFGPTESEA